MASEMDQDVEIVVVDVEAVASGYRVSELMRSTVVNDRGERIGTIDDFVIGADDRVLFAVLQVGGFLGLGGRLVAVPYDSLLLADTVGKPKIVLPGATREALEQLPEFAYAS
jgi:sporulation protein YlmC with PRC-barrel domain